MEEVYDLGSEADDALAVQQILEYVVMQYLEDLENDDLYSRKHSKSKKASVDQHDTLEDITKEIWSSVKRMCTMADYKSLPCLDTEQKQEALKKAVKCGELNQQFLRNFMLRTWEGARVARKKGSRNTQNPKKCRLELEVDSQKVALITTPSAEATISDVSISG
ncbi:hypothetical protein N7467_004954 [Penicillium canescens]|nr:hypothetical protein N7467_004954 [Penicillium canescens]